MHERWHDLCEKLRNTLYHQGECDEHTWLPDGSEVSGFVVVPRMDGGFGIYYSHGKEAPYTVRASVTQERITHYREVLARSGIRTSVQQPTADGAFEWLLYRPLTPQAWQEREAAIKVALK